MLSVGDKVVYPMHGAGIVKSTEEKTINGETREYFVLQMVFGQMTLMIPINSVEVVGIRLVIGKNQLDRKLTEFLAAYVKKQSYANWNKRVHLYNQKLKSGNVCQVADVIREITVQAKNKKLSAGERRILALAKQILISEIMLSFSCDLTTAQTWLETQFLTC